MKEVRPHSWVLNPEDSHARQHNDFHQIRLSTASLGRKQSDYILHTKQQREKWQGKYPLQFKIKQLFQNFEHQSTKIQYKMLT